MSKRLNNLDRRTMYAVTWASWGTALVLTGLLIADVVPEESAAETGVGMLIVGFIGVAMTTGMAHGRRFQTDVLAEVFATGLHAALTIRKSMVTRLKTLHTEDYLDGTTVCVECGKPFPCPTRKCLDELGNQLIAEMQDTTRGSKRTPTPSS